MGILPPQTKEYVVETDETIGNRISHAVRSSILLFKTTVNSTSLHTTDCSWNNMGTRGEVKGWLWL